MEEYKNYTNSELETELERLKKEYGEIQDEVLGKYQHMLELAQKYGEAKDILETRTGKKKESK